MAATLGAANPFRYKGYYYDVETGLYYLNSRYYNSEWGRFINADSFVGNMGNLPAYNLWVISYRPASAGLPSFLFPARFL